MTKQYEWNVLNCINRLIEPMASKTCKLARPRGYKTFSCSTQLSMKFEWLIKKTTMLNPAFKLSNVVFTMLVNIKMPTIIGILTFMSRIHFKLSQVEHEKIKLTSGPVPTANAQISLRIPTV